MSTPQITRMFGRSPSAMLAHSPSPGPVPDPLLERRGALRSWPTPETGDIADPAARAAEYGRGMTAADVVARQVEAYNSADLEAFLACYAPTVVIRSGDGTLLSDGLEAMRSSYAEWFGSLPGLRAEIVTRVEQGSWVVDDEHVTAPSLDLRALVAYRVQDGLIDQVVIMTDEEVSADE